MKFYLLEVNSKTYPRVPNYWFDEKVTSISFVLLSWFQIMRSTKVQNNRNFSVENSVLYKMTLRRSTISFKIIEMKKVRTLLGIWSFAGGTIWFLPSTVAFTKCNFSRRLKKREEEEGGDETQEASETIIVSEKLLTFFPSSSLFFFSSTSLFRQAHKKKHKMVVLLSSTSFIWLRKTLN